MPEGVCWCSSSGGYWFIVNADQMTQSCEEMNLRLDTFTRFQETTDVYVSLIEEMVADLMIAHDTGFVASDWVNRANKAMGKIE